MQLHDKSDTALPLADTASREHSDRVAAHLRRVIRESGGSIGFGEFMQQALYAPGLGYYVSGARKFGADGDFITAPEVSPLFGRVLAQQIAPLMRAGEGMHILELGPGTGALAVQVMQKLDELDALPVSYGMLEVSADLKDRQQQRIADELAPHRHLLHWQAGLPHEFRGVVIANEVADALPVERFVRTANDVRQLTVALDGPGFCLKEQKAPEWLQLAVNAIEESLGHRLPAGYRSEFSPGLSGWLRDLAASIEYGFVFLFDYGIARREYYAPDRDGGWLRCHYRHRAHNDALLNPGIQDITSWVDFTAVAEAAVLAGMDVAGYVTQSQFLLDGGLACELEDFAARNTRDQLILSRQVKLLTLPGEMGEHFKCIGLSLGNVMTPNALRRADRSHAL